MCEELNKIHRDIINCCRCSLRRTINICTHPVHGTGNPNANIMLIGEAPGETEMDYSTPFVGLAGKTLDKMLAEANISRDECYITNVVKCRPTTNNGRKNRAPTDEEVQKCKAWLWHEIKLVNPLIIVLLGKVAVNTLLHNHLPKNYRMKDMLHKMIEVEYIDSKFTIIYHPSFLMQHGKKYIEECTDILRSVKLISEAHNDNT